MILQDLHTHTVFCDGANTPEEMVQAALKKGMYRIGFSGHSYVPGDEDYCMTPERTKTYQETVRVLQKKYEGRIKILLGVEQDYFSQAPTEEYDYVIGSAHTVMAGEDPEHLVIVDGGKDLQREGVDRYFDGDYYAFAEAYFAQMTHIVERTDCDIIGHFDLVTKYNEERDLFDPCNPRYVRAWQQAVDALLPTGRLFEINTGAIFRGYRKDPYPAKDMIEYIRERGGRFILSGDCHCAEALCYRFEGLEQYVTELPPKFDL